MSHVEAAQMYAVTCSTGHDVGWGPMNLLYAQTFASRMNALSIAESHQTGSKVCVYRVIVFWIQAVVKDAAKVEKPIVRVN